jgi:histidinol-phosphate aminotransferase
MENPYRWPPELVEAGWSTLRAVASTATPIPARPNSRKPCAGWRASRTDQVILLGNGSDELIQMMFWRWLRRGGWCMAPEPSFVMYRMIATLRGHGLRRVCRWARTSPSTWTAMLAAIEAHQPAVVFLAYPNNPTGNLFPPRPRGGGHPRPPRAWWWWTRPTRPSPTTPSSIDLGRYPNLLVMRTVSKQGLAGLRLGYLCGRRPGWRSSTRLRLPYNINVLTQASAAFALQPSEVLEEQAAAIRRDRAVLMLGPGRIAGRDGLSQRGQLHPVPRAGRAGDRVFEGLKAKGVLIKNLSPQGGPSPTACASPSAARRRTSLPAGLGCAEGCS